MTENMSVYYVSSLLDGDAVLVCIVPDLKQMSSCVMDLEFVCCVLDD